MNVPNVELAGCDAFLWREGNEYYCLVISENTVYRVGSVAAFIQGFPRDRSLCIMNDETRQAVRIPPIAN